MFHFVAAYVYYNICILYIRARRGHIQVIRYLSAFVPTGTLQELISHTMIHWVQESFIQNPELVRQMFSLLHRQYDGLGELTRALPKAYAISAVSVQDSMELLECLGQIRSLLIVQMGPEEERLMIQSIGSVGMEVWMVEKAFIDIKFCLWKMWCA